MEVFGSQIVTIVTIILSALFWLFVFWKQKLLSKLKSLLLPIILWIIFGTLDIVVTAKGTFGNPQREGNPATVWFLEQFGAYGPAVASLCWIFLWVGIVFILLKFLKNERISNFVSIIIFYALASMHFIGFSTWFIPLCSIAQTIQFENMWIIPGIVGLKSIFFGVILSITHFSASNLLRKSLLKKRRKLRFRKIV